MKLGPFELNQTHIGHTLELLKQLPDNSIHTVITSPPYFRLRNYGTDPVPWPEISFAPMAGLPEITIPEQIVSLGLEEDIWAYIGHLVAVFREVRRILHSQGVLWVNMGDSYASSGKAGGVSSKTGLNHGNGVKDGQKSAYDFGRANTPDGLKPKDLIGIPFRLAFALQADGWFLRSDIPWVKRNSMPGSQTDRPTAAKEYWFLLSKSEKYFYDQEAVRMPFADNRNGNPGPYKRTSSQAKGANNNRQDLVFLNNGNGWNEDAHSAGRYRRDVDWFFDSLRAILDGDQAMLQDEDPLALVINPKPYKAAHFATFPGRLVEPMILSSCPEKTCPECGSPWARVVEKVNKSLPVGERHGRTGHNGQPPQISGNYWTGPTTQTTDTFQPTCTHNLEPIPGIVLDPFIGSGTVAQEAIRRGRRWIGFELNPEYGEKLVTERCNGTQIRFG